MLVAKQTWMTQRSGKVLASVHFCETIQLSATNHENYNSRGRENNMTDSLLANSTETQTLKLMRVHAAFLIEKSRALPVWPGTGYKSRYNVRMLGIEYGDVRGQEARTVWLRQLLQIDDVRLMSYVNRVLGANRTHITYKIQIPGMDSVDPERVFFEIGIEEKDSATNHVFRVVGNSGLTGGDDSISGRIMRVTGKEISFGTEVVLSIYQSNTACLVYTPQTREMLVTWNRVCVGEMTIPCRSEEHLIPCISAAFAGVSITVEETIIFVQSLQEMCQEEILQQVGRPKDILQLGLPKQLSKKILEKSGRPSEDREL